jgi:uncharacterized integral membrane protein
MDLKLNNTNLSGKYVQVPNNNMNETTDTSDIEALYRFEGHQGNKVYKKTTFTVDSKDKNNCKCYVKYSLIFSGILAIILMVVFGINNVGVEYGYNNSTNTVVNTTTPLVVNTTTPLVVNTTTPLVVNITTPLVVNITTPLVVNITTPLVVNTTTPLVVNTTTPLVVNTTPLIPSPKQMLDMLDEDYSIESTSPENTEITTEQEGQDVIISNKTVIINGGNGSVVITN